MFAGCGEQVLAALQSPGNPAVWETSVAYIFSLGDNNFADKTTPVLGSKNGPQNGSIHSVQFDLLVRAIKTDPKTGVVLSSFDCFRGYATVPLGFQFAILRHALQACMLLLNGNMCGHKCSQGVENKYSRRCKALETQRYGKLLSRTFFRSVTTILPTKRPPFWGPKTDPKMESIHSVSI